MYILVFISIVLTVSLSTVSLIFLGDSISQQQSKSLAAEFINVGQQTAAAFSISRVDGEDPNVWINRLVPQYLSKIPEFNGEPLYFHDTHKNYMIAFVSEKVCSAINRNAGIDGDNPDITTHIYSCVMGTDGAWPVAYYRVINAKII